MSTPNTKWHTQITFACEREGKSCQILNFYVPNKIIIYEELKEKNTVEELVGETFQPLIARKKTDNIDLGLVWQSLSKIYFGNDKKKFLSLDWNKLWILSKAIIDHNEKQKDAGQKIENYLIKKRTTHASREFSDLAPLLQKNLEIDDSSWEVRADVTGREDRLDKFKSVLSQINKIVANKSQGGGPLCRKLVCGSIHFHIVFQAPDISNPKKSTIITDKNIRERIVLFWYVMNIHEMFNLYQIDSSPELRGMWQKYLGSICFPYFERLLSEIVKEGFTIENKDPTDGGWVGQYKYSPVGFRQCYKHEPVSGRPEHSKDIFGFEFRASGYRSLEKDIFPMVSGVVNFLSSYENFERPILEPGIGWFSKEILKKKKSSIKRPDELKKVFKKIEDWLQKICTKIEEEKYKNSLKLKKNLNLDDSKVRDKKVRELWSMIREKIVDERDLPKKEYSGKNRQQLKEGIEEVITLELRNFLKKAVIEKLRKAEDSKAILDFEKEVLEIATGNGDSLVNEMTEVWITYLTEYIPKLKSDWLSMVHLWGLKHMKLVYQGERGEFIRSNNLPSPYRLDNANNNGRGNESLDNTLLLPFYRWEFHPAIRIESRKDDFQTARVTYMEIFKDTIPKCKKHKNEEKKVNKLAPLMKALQDWVKATNICEKLKFPSNPAGNGYKTYYHNGEDFSDPSTPALKPRS